MRFEVLTIFPDFFDSPRRSSLLGKAVDRGLVSLTVTDIRNFAAGRHRVVDDTPYGGGSGMVMKPEPVVAAIESAAARQPEAPRILLGPRGVSLTQVRARSFAREPGLILVCGHYEGIDERVRDWIDEEISIGDYVLSGGESAALVVIDAVARLVPGFVGNQESLHDESFEESLLEYPQYTRPEMFRGRAVPEVLLSGNHARVARWRRTRQLRITRDRRPDLLEKATLSREDVRLLEEADEDGRE